MGKDRHEGTTFVDAVAEAFEVSVIIPEAGVDLLDGTEDTALGVAGGITSRRPDRVIVEVIGEAARKALVKAGSGKEFRVFDVCRRTEADPCFRVETGQG